MLDKQKILAAYSLGRTDLGLFVAIEKQLIVPAPIPRKYSLVWGSEQDYTYNNSLWVPSHMTIVHGMFSHLLAPGLRQQFQKTYNWPMPNNITIPKVSGLGGLPPIFPGKIFFLGIDGPFPDSDKLAIKMADRLRGVPREEFLYDNNYWLGLEEDLESRDA